MLKNYFGYTISYQSNLTVVTYLRYSGLVDVESNRQPAEDELDDIDNEKWTKKDGIIICGGYNRRHLSRCIIQTTTVVIVTFNIDKF